MIGFRSQGFLLVLFCLILLFAQIHAFRRSGFTTKLSFIRKNRLNMSTGKIPLEIQDKIDPKRSWDVTFIFNGVEKTVNVPEGVPVLTSGNKVFNNELPFSCLNGVCMTCACQILKGRENIVTAVQGVGDPQLEAGFSCACQTYPAGPGIVIKLGTYDECYESQYGQFEKSYGELKYTKKGDEKKKGPFGF